MLNEAQTKWLLGEGFTRGLANSLNEMKKVFALRYWIIDNSGSMQKTDGHRIVPGSSTLKGGSKKATTFQMVGCSRWEEISECVTFHIRMAALLEAPTRFRLLNNPGANVGPQQFSVACDFARQDGAHDDGYHCYNSPEMTRQVQLGMGIMSKARPGGCTPLTSHVLEIYNEISLMEPELRRLGKRVVAHERTRIRRRRLQP
jgi:hypothetical protein